MGGRKKTIIILCIVLAALIVLTAVAWLVIPQLTEDDPSSEPDMIPILSFDATFIEKMQVSNPSFGDDYCILKGRKAGTTVYSVEGDDVFPYNQTYFGMSVDMVAACNAHALVEKDAKDLAKYGITDESGLVTVSLSDGSTHTLHFGEEYPFNSDYIYMTPDQTNDVYTIAVSYYNTLCGPVTSYRDLNLIPDFIEETYENLQGYRCTTKNGYVLEISRTVDAAFSAFEEIRPIRGEADGLNTQDKLLKKLDTISVSAVVEDYPKDLSLYGLDHPSAELWFKLTDGTETTILVGSASDQYIFLMRKDLPMVVVASGDFSFVDLKGEEILESAIFMYSIKNVLRVTYSTPEKTYVFNVDDRKDDQGNGTFSADFMGKSMVEEEARSLYTGFLGFCSVGAVTTEVTSKPEYVLTFDMRDGSQNRMELCRQNSRQYAAVINGVCHHYVSVTAINHMSELITMVKNGESIADIF